MGGELFRVLRLVRPLNRFTFFRFGLLRTEGKSSIREIGICVRKKFLISLPTVGEGTQY